jgi:hypothetical protein
MTIIGRCVPALALLAALGAGPARAESVAAPPPAQGAAIPGAWKEQVMDLDYMGFTDRYTCTGLRDSVERVLRALGARPDYSVMETGCDAPFRRRMNFPGVHMKFAVLIPANAPDMTAGTPVAAPGAAGGAPGDWRDVNLINRDALSPDECELAEMIVHDLLPRFAVRNVQRPAACMPHAPSSNSQLHVEVFAPLAQAGR